MMDQTTQTSSDSKNVAPVQSKACTKCGEVKDLSHFHNDRRKPDGKVSTCKPCKAARDKIHFSKEEVKARRNTKEARLKQRNWHLLKQYGITHSEYERMLAEQGGTCSCCPATPDQETNGVFKVDHCHTTGKVRGLLCNKCNVTLGNVNDDPLLLERLASYVRIHKDHSA